MLVYTNTLQGFLTDVSDNVIDEKVRIKVHEQLQLRVGESEFQSWGNSLSRVGMTLMTAGLPEDAGVSIECQLPMSSKRIDFILSGYDEDGHPQVVIVELKQWSEASVSENDALVKTWLGGGLHDTAHPSYQAWSYAAYLAGFNEAVETHQIQLHPCAFLHNCTETTALLDDRYSSYTSQAPLFFKTDAEKLRNFLQLFVRRGDRGELMYTIDHGRIRPSKSLANSLGGLLRNQREFILLDEQKVAYETVLGAIRQTHADVATPKQVIIVRGGPGTGKSVVAVNLLVRSLQLGVNAAYVTKNAAPRAVYESKLTGILTKSRFSSLFKGSGAFTECEADTFGALIVDEAHRLIVKSGLYSNLGENQILELIRAARTTVSSSTKTNASTSRTSAPKPKSAHTPWPKAPSSTSTFPPNFAATAPTATSPSSISSSASRKRRTPRWKTSTTSSTLRSPRWSWTTGSRTQSQRHLGPPGRRLLLGLEKQERQPRHGHRIPGVRLCAPMEFVGRRRPLDHETESIDQMAESTPAMALIVSTSASSLAPTCCATRPPACAPPTPKPAPKTTAASSAGSPQ